MTEKNYGPIWQLKEGVKSKKLLVEAFDADISRAQQKRSAALAELDQYRDVLKRLGESEE